MENWETLIIKDTFKRCYGLQDGIKNGINKTDKLLLEAGLDSLRIQSGMSAEFIKSNLEEILKIEL